MTSSSSNTLTEIKDREDAIYRILISEEIDLRALRLHSREVGGFIDNEIRRRVWPKLLGVNRFEIPDYRVFIETHKDLAQVKLDVERSLWYHEHTMQWSEHLRGKRRQALCDIIMSVLSRNPEFNYYQGYHDVVSIFLLVFEEDHLAFAMTEIMSSRYLLDYLGKDFDILSKSMWMIMNLVALFDPLLGEYLGSARVEPFFATSWIITWFSHDVKKITDIARIFDVMLSSHPIFIFYLCAATVINMREIILKCECEFSSLFSLLVHAPSDKNIFFEKVLKLADNIMIVIPPDKLKKNVDYEMKKIIEKGSVQSFLTPKHLTMKSVQSDWILLRNRNCRRSSNILNHQKKIIPTGKMKVINTGNSNSQITINKNDKFKWFTDKNQNFVVYLFENLKNSNMRKMLRKNNVLIEKKYSYIGPFKEYSAELNYGLLFGANDLNKYFSGRKGMENKNSNFISSCWVEKLQILDENLHSIEFLFVVTAVLAGLLGSSVYCHL